MLENFIRNNANTIVWSLLSVLMVCILAIIWLYNIVTYRFPDIEKSVETVKSEQRESIRESQSLISKKLDESSKTLEDNFKKQNDRIVKVESNISTLKVSLIGLMSKVGKAPSETQLKALLSSADEFSAIKSASLKEAKFNSDLDKLPSTQNFKGWAGVAANLGLDIPQNEVVQGTKDPEQIKTLFNRALVSDNPHWTTENSKLSVKYENGSILFTPKSNMSIRELQELANELNGVKESLPSQSSEVKNWAKSNDKNDGSFKFNAPQKEPENSS